MRTFGKLGVVVITSVLAACAGGGGGGNSRSPAAFVSFPLSPSSSTILSGDSVQGTMTYDLGTGNITSQTSNPQQSGATITIAVDSTGTPTRLGVTTTSGTHLTWIYPADTIGYLNSNPNILGAVSANDQNIVLAGNVWNLGWNYQDFGFWASDSGTGTVAYGAASFGAATPAASIPVTGTATYNGMTLGLYTDATGALYATSSSLTSSVNFSARTLTYTSSGTQQAADFSTFSANSALDTTGTLSYSAGSNQFTGAVHNTGSTLTGTATGRFYGPAAEEIGGTFSQSGSAGHYVGGFGARK